MTTLYDDNTRALAERDARIAELERKLAKARLALLHIRSGLVFSFAPNQKKHEVQASFARAAVKEIDNDAG